MGIAAVAEYLDVTEPTVRRWIRELGLPVHRIGGGANGHLARLRFYRSEVDEWVRNRYAADSAAHPTRGASRQRPDGLIG